MERCSPRSGQYFRSRSGGSGFDLRAQELASFDQFQSGFEGRIDVEGSSKVLAAECPSLGLLCFVNTVQVSAENHFTQLFSFWNLASSTLADFPHVPAYIQ